MSYEELSHSPEFDLPDYGPAFPEDLRGVIEEHHEGLTKVSVSKKLARNKYDPICTIICQDPKTATRKTRPIASPDEIAEYVMCCIQYEIDSNDEPGNYKAEIIGPPGRSRFQYSKHIDLSDGDGVARSISMMNQEDITEQQGQYIGELHSQIVAMMELQAGQQKVLVQENKEMMKIVSESVRRVGEVEAMRLNHELQMRMHNDDIAAKQAAEESRLMRWKELLNVVKDTGAPEAILKAVLKKVNQPTGEKKGKPSEPGKQGDEGPKGSPWKNEEKPPSEESPTPEEKTEKKKSGTKGGSKGQRRKPKTPEPAAPEESEADDSELTDEELEAKFYKEGLEKLDKNPLVMAAEALKMSIDVNKQWHLVRETLSSEQYEALEDAFAASTDEEVSNAIVRLYELKGAKKLMKLSDHLDEQQQTFVNLLMEAVVPD